MRNVSAATPDQSASPAGADGVDGRSTRWDEHRERRRADLVAATLRAIRVHGASVGMDDIAAVAGTSKPVFYRHFDDRAGLYRAVVAHVDEVLLHELDRPGDRGDDGRALQPRALLERGVDTYLRLVETDPEVYRFIVAAPIVPARERAQGDPATAATDAMSGRVADLLASLLVDAGRPVGQAERWARAVVGLVRSTADGWLRAGAGASGTSRAQLVTDLTDLLWNGLAPVFPG